MGHIVLRVHDVRNADGKVRAGVYTAAGFKRFGGAPAIASSAVDASEGTVTIDLGEVPPGTYAVSAYHDENDNGVLDLTFVGVPAEGRGYSRVPRAALAPPSFDEASFEHGTRETQLTVSLAYLSHP